MTGPYFRHTLVRADSQRQCAGPPDKEGRWHSFLQDRQGSCIRPQDPAVSLAAVALFDLESNLGSAYVPGCRACCMLQVHSACFWCICLVVMVYCICTLQYNTIQSNPLSHIVPPPLPAVSVLAGGALTTRASCPPGTALTATRFVASQAISASRRSAWQHGNIAVHTLRQ